MRGYFLAAVLHDTHVGVGGPVCVGLEVGWGWGRGKITRVCVCVCVLVSFSARAPVRHRGKSSSAVSCGSPLSGLVDRPAFPPYFLPLFLPFHPTSPPTLFSITWITAATERARGWKQLQTALLTRTQSVYAVWFALYNELISSPQCHEKQCPLVACITASCRAPFHYLAALTDAAVHVEKYLRQMLSHLHMSPFQPSLLDRKPRCQSRWSLSCLYTPGKH